MTGVKLPGQATAVAEGNALGKGALVYHLFPLALQTIQARASGNTPAHHIHSHSCTAHLLTFLHSACDKSSAQCIWCCTVQPHGSLWGPVNKAKA